jgi:hypothetical protein
MRCAGVMGFMLLLAAPLTLAQEEVAPSTDLTAPDAVGTGWCKPEIIDTTKFVPQIQPSWPWEGRVREVKNLLPPHSRPKKTGTDVENGLPVGGLSETPVALPGAFFPGVQQTPWAPPDPTLAVGPNHIVTTVNMVVAFYDKGGGLQFSANLDSTGNPGFFETVGAGTFTFDPKCFYDTYNNRFVVLALETYGSTESWIDIAVSDDSDPNGIWYKYRTNSAINISGSLYWVDYPGLGYDAQGYYVTGNLFPLSGGGFGGVLYRCFDKSRLLNGQTAVWKDVRDGSSGSVQGAHHVGNPIAPFFVEDWGSPQIRVHAVRNPLTTPAISNFDVTVPSYNYPPGSAPNIGGGTLDVLDGRIINAFWRNGHLYAGHGIGSGSKTVARWYQFNTNNWPTSGSVTYVQGGNIDPGSGQWTWFPAIAEDVNGNVGIVVARSSSTTYASVQATGRKPTDPLGQMAALTPLFVGDAGYNGRWGDFFGIGLDPFTGYQTFYCIGEYATAGGWGTWIQRFNIGPLLGDMNCDGFFDGFDIDTFFLALGDPAQWQAQYPGCDINAGDINGDGYVDGFDIDLFFQLLAR